MVKSKENTAEALLEALKAGSYYSSTVPELYGLHWGDRSVIVEISAVRSVIVKGQGSAAVAMHGHSMTRTGVALERFKTAAGCASR